MCHGPCSRVAELRRINRLPPQQTYRHRGARLRLVETGACACVSAAVLAPAEPRRVHLVPGRARLSPSVPRCCCATPGKAARAPAPATRRRPLPGHNGLDELQLRPGGQPRTDDASLVPNTNRYADFNGYTLSYDEEGNLLSKSRNDPHFSQTYTWGSSPA